jgi:hypothetical protein
MTPAERLVERLISAARDQATTHAIRRLLERRPDLRPPAALPDLPVLIPPEEDAAYSLDRLELMAWVARQVDQAVEVDVGPRRQRDASAAGSPPRPSRRLSRSGARCERGRRAARLHDQAGAATRQRRRR